MLVPIDGAGTAAGPRPEPAARVVDLATWIAATPRPAVPVPLLPVPPRPVEAAGAGLRIALVDGAVDHSHPDLAEACVVTWPPGRGAAPDQQATAFASLLVGQGRAHVRGVVPDAELLVAPVRADGAAALPTGHGEDELVARAVRWAVARGAHVVVLPHGRRRLGRRVATTLRSATLAGVRVFASAGNLGPAVVAFPAAVAGVLAVTAHDDAGLLPQCSATADVAAPGRDVPAAGPRRRAHLQGCGPATVLAAGCHLLWLEQAGLVTSRAAATR